jgi:hypothetical protein
MYKQLGFRDQGFLGFLGFFRVFGLFQVLLRLVIAFGTNLARAEIAAPI